MSITKETLQHTADLARLDLSLLGPDEVEGLVGQTLRVLAYVDELLAVDTTGVEPTIHPVSLDLPLRADEPRPTPGAAAVVANAPRSVDQQFVVPRVAGQGADDE